MKAFKGINYFLPWDKVRWRRFKDSIVEAGWIYAGKNVLVWFVIGDSL